MNLAELSREVGETVAGRPGGAVSLAVGFAQIFNGLPGFTNLMSFWYHFAIMFEALFILTTIDAGTRVARFMVQEFGGRGWKKFERTDWLPGNIIATTLVVCVLGVFPLHREHQYDLADVLGPRTSSWPQSPLPSPPAISSTRGRNGMPGSPLCRWCSLLRQLTLTAGILNITDNFWPSHRVRERGYRDM